MDLDHERMSYLLYQTLCGIKHLHSAGKSNSKPFIPQDLARSDFSAPEHRSIEEGFSANTHAELSVFLL